MTTKFRFLPGAYEDFEGGESEYFAYVEHFAARSQRGFICSKQYKIVDGDLTAVGGKCLGCEERDRGAEDVSWRLLHAFNGIHLAYFHLEPVVDDKGKEILYTKGDRKGEQVLRKVECEGRRCKFCADKLEKVFGKKVHMSVGTGHLQDLSGVITEIEKDCVSCGGQGTLIESIYECSKCANPLIDLNKTDLDQKAIQHLISHPMDCSCGHRDYPLRQLECSECKDPRPLSLFDCDVDIKRQGEGTNSTIQIPRWTPTILSKELEEMAKPWPFKRIFAPDSFEWQAKVLKIRNPYGDNKQEDHASDYTTEEEAVF